MKLKCKNCEKEFERKRKPKDLNNTFCCLTCASEARRVRIKCNCGYCGKELEKLPNELKRSKSGLMFCDKSCACSYNNTILRSGVNNPNYIAGNRLSANYITKAFKLYKAKCAKCLMDDIDCLEVHHIDENHSNNEDDNLLILCSNCHTLIHKNRFTIKDCIIEKLESFEEYKEIIQDKFKNKCSVCLKNSQNLDENKICSNCLDKYSEFPNRKLPENDKLIKLLELYTKSELGRYFKVSATTIANRIK